MYFLSNLGSGDGGMEWVDRGDIADADFALTDLTLDSTDRVLDLSSIVGAGVRRVALHVIIASESAGGNIVFKTNGNANTYNSAKVYTTTASSLLEVDVFVTTDADGKIEYNGDDNGMLVMAMSVRGWFA